jgi:hypothetical protein
MVEPKKGTKWPKELPKFTSRQEAIGVCKDLCAGHFMHRSEKVGKGELEVSYLACFMRGIGILVPVFQCARENIWQQFIESPIGIMSVSKLVLLAA